MMNTFQMFLVGILSALLSSMSVWANSASDVYLSLNDFYMAGLMTGWMFLFEGLLMGMMNWIVIGGVLVVGMLVCIRQQLFVGTKQFAQGMIPHHSMAVLMSKRYLERGSDVAKPIAKLATGIIKSQSEEIGFMKDVVGL